MLPSQNDWKKEEPMEGIEPTTPRLQITCSGQLSYIGNDEFCSLFEGDCKDTTFCDNSAKKCYFFDTIVPVA